jgi:hypothetical protein
MAFADQDLVSNADCSAASHVGIERKPATESAADILEDLWVTLESIWVDGRHRAPPA